MTVTVAARRFRLGLRSARWLVLGVFPILYIVSLHSLGPLSPWFAVLTLVNALACAVLLTQLGRPASRALWAWIGLAVFLDGDFFKMMVLARRLNDPDYIASLYPELEWLTRQTLLHGYSWMTLGFVTYCVVAALTLSRPARPRVSSLPDRARVLLRADFTLDMAALVFLAYLLATLLQVKSGYGVLGAGNQGLSGPIGAVLTLYRRYLTPALLLLALWIFDRRNPLLAGLVTLSILVAGVVDAFATNSRGSVIAFMAPVLLLFLLTRRFTAPRRAFIAGAAIAVVVLFPIISAIRFHTGSATDGRSVPALHELVGSGTVVLARVQGAEGVWFGLPFGGTPLGLSRTVRFLRPPTMRNYYTYSVVGVTEPNTFEAPGLIGAFMIIGGAGGVIVLMSGFVLLVDLGWTRIAKSFETWPVALALSASYLLGFVSEGTLLLGELVKLGLVIVTVELVYTRLLGRNKRVGRRRHARANGEQDAPAQRPAITGPWGMP